MKINVNRDLSIFPEKVYFSKDRTKRTELSLTLEKDRKEKDTFRSLENIQLVFKNIAGDKFVYDIIVGSQEAPDGSVTYSIESLPSRDNAGVNRFFSGINNTRQTISLSKDVGKLKITWIITGWTEDTYEISGMLNNDPDNDLGPITLEVIDVEGAQPVVVEPVKITLNEAKRDPTTDQLLWVLIRNRTIDFRRYKEFIDKVMCEQNEKTLSSINRALYVNRLPFHRAASYSLLKYATEYYMMQETGLVPVNGTSINWDLMDSLKYGNYESELQRTARPKIDLSELRRQYLEELEDEEGKALPYFKLIKQKLSEIPLKSANEIPFNVDISFGNNGSEQRAKLGIEVDLPYADACYGILKSKLLSPPLLELIWSYFQEEGGLVQTMNAISLRFQNVRKSGADKDPLANLNLDPLRPMSNIIWGFVEDERNRTTINRRNLEYQYEYGISMIGKAVQNIPVAEHRTHFLRAFHDLLRATIEFFQQANFTTVIPDGFPILNHLREVHLLLAEGAHNQYGDLPWTARVEMLVQQWILARPEIREFLGGRIMVPYTEPWMDRVDTMKQLQGWNPTNITHFRDLGTFGEQLLLSIRYGSWNDPNIGATNAANWAHYWRQEIQRYIHAYKAATGVDLASDLSDARINLPGNEDRYLQPSALIERQVALQQNGQSRSKQLSNGQAKGKLSANGQIPQNGQPIRRETLNG